MEKDSVKKSYSIKAQENKKMVLVFFILISLKQIKNTLIDLQWKNQSSKKHIMKY